MARAISHQNCAIALLGYRTSRLSYLVHTTTSRRSLHTNIVPNHQRSRFHNAQHRFFDSFHRDFQLYLLSNNQLQWPEAKERVARPAEERSVLMEARNSRVTPARLVSRSVKLHRDPRFILSCFDGFAHRVAFPYGLIHHPAKSRPSFNDTIFIPLARAKFVNDDKHDQAACIHQNHRRNTVRESVIHAS